MTDDKLPPIIIKKVKKGGHGHHGGAWKVAYADFVTAMMAFFLLLWLLSTSSKGVLNGLADYFSPTVGLKDGKGIGLQGGLADVKNGTGREHGSNNKIVYGAQTSGPPIDIETIKKQQEEKTMVDFQNTVFKAMQSDELTKNFMDNIYVDVTPEGIRIQIRDSDERPMFKPGTAILQPYAETILKKIADTIRYVPHYLAIYGHTTSTTTVLERGSDYWSLSSERADSVRQFLTSSAGIDHSQVARVIGEGNNNPIDRANPQALRNARFELVLLKQSDIGDDGAVPSDN